MKVRINTFIPDCDKTIDTIAIGINGYKLDKEYQVKEGYTYYSFITESKTWIRHSGKLTKEEKQWVIEHENKKHTCFEASHIECSCNDKCLRNINNY